MSGARRWTRRRLLPGSTRELEALGFREQALQLVRVRAREIKNEFVFYWFTLKFERLRPLPGATAVQGALVRAKQNARSIFYFLTCESVTKKQKIIEWNKRAMDYVWTIYSLGHE
jgi:hypothetical protein